MVSVWLIRDRSNPQGLGSSMVHAQSSSLSQRLGGVTRWHGQPMTEVWSQFVSSFKGLCVP